LFRVGDDIDLAAFDRGVIGLGREVGLKNLLGLLDELVGLLFGLRDLRLLGLEFLPFGIELGLFDAVFLGLVVSLLQLSDGDFRAIPQAGSGVAMEVFRGFRVGVRVGLGLRFGGFGPVRFVTLGSSLGCLGCSGFVGGIEPVQCAFKGYGLVRRLRRDGVLFFGFHGSQSFHARGRTSGERTHRFVG
jgi:hypothetical protein